ncbi:MAG: hypothetical protein K2X82_11025, partial [Gemmataceae bacterium]|nr:hypothetical protein [Gemmataceae bacterium]
MLRLLLAAGLVAAAAPPAPAGVVVLANFTSAPVTVTVAEPGQKPRPVALAASQVARVVVRGPADLLYPAKPAEVRARVDPYHAYVLVPDEAAGRRLEGVELPGKPPERDARPEADAPPAAPVEVRVKLLVDDADPRADALWQKTLKARLTEAAAVVEAHSGVRLVLADFGTWESDPTADSLPRLLADFADKVKAGPGELAVGYTSRKLPPDDPGFADAKGFPSRHVLLREWRPRTEAAKVEVLLHHLGLALGAVPLPDPGSVMRPKLADGLANHTEYRYRFDPLNALAMSIWAEERRRGPLGEPADASPAGRARLARVYGAILKARPGESRALAYLNALDAAAPEAVAQVPPPPGPKKDGPPAPIEPSAGKVGRDGVAAAVVRGVAARAKKLGATQVPRTGDDLTVTYIEAAVAAALAA